MSLRDKQLLIDTIDKKTSRLMGFNCEIHFDGYTLKCKYKAIRQEINLPMNVTNSVFVNLIRISIANFYASVVANSSDSKDPEALTKLIATSIYNVLYN